MIKKRGMSNLVSSVLLITSAIAIAILIFVWISHSSQEETEKSTDISTAEEICKDIEIRITEASWTGSAIKLGIENLENRKITSLRVRIEYEGEVEVKKIEGELNPYETIHREITPKDNAKSATVRVIPEITLQAPEIESAEAGWWLCSNKAAEAIVS